MNQSVSVTSELLLSARHFSNLRFAMMTVYFAASIGLATIILMALDTQSLEDSSVICRWLAYIGVFLSVMFGIFEYVASKRYVDIVNAIHIDESDAKQVLFGEKVRVWGGVTLLCLSAYTVVGSSWVYISFAFL